MSVEIIEMRAQKRTNKGWRKGSVFHLYMRWPKAVLLAQYTPQKAQILLEKDRRFLHRKFFVGLASLALHNPVGEVILSMNCPTFKICIL